MPPWLVALLQQNNSRGMLDTLTALTGTNPSFVASPVLQHQGKDSGTVAGRLMKDKEGKLVIGLTPFTLANFSSEALEAGYPKNYQPEKAKFGDAVIQHEFGHIAANTAMGHDLEKVDPNAGDSESLADRFQNAFQFLRDHSTNTEKITDPQTRQIIDILLQQPIMKNHPINMLRQLVPPPSTSK